MLSTSGVKRGHAGFIILQLLMFIFIVVLLSDFTDKYNITSFINKNIIFIIISIIFTSSITLLFSYIRNSRIEAIISILLFISAIVLLKLNMETDIYKIAFDAKNNYLKNTSLIFKGKYDEKAISSSDDIYRNIEYSQDNSSNSKNEYISNNTNASSGSIISSSENYSNYNENNLSEDVTEDVKRMAQSYLPITDEAFEATEKFMNSSEGTSDYREAQGEMIREAAKSTANIAIEGGKEALEAVTSKDFWNGIFNNQ